MLTALTSKRRKYLSDMLKLCTQRNYFLTTPKMNTIFATNQGITCHLIYNEQWRQLFLKVTPENTFLFVLEAVEVFLQT